MSEMIKEPHCNCHKLRLERNIMLLITLIIFTANIILTIKLYRSQQIVILLPTIDRELQISSDYVSAEYLKLRAEQIIYLLFSMNSGNIEYVTKELLKQVEEESLQDFRTQVEKLGEDIKAKNYRYFFTDIKNFEIDITNLTVKISGYLLTYFAGKEINQEFKEYQLKFCNHVGLVKLKSFTQVQREQ